MSRAIFMDRDGTVMADVGYPRQPDDVELLPGAAETLARLRALGFKLIVVSNQSGIGRGLVTADEAAAVHKRFVAELRAHGVELDGAYYCPHSPEDACTCRKPLPGLIEQAARELGVDLADSFMVGDKESDVEAGRRAGCRTIAFSSWEDVYARIQTQVPA